jgi:hypothetical protein
MFAIENGHAPNCANALAIEPLLDQGHEPFPLVPLGSHLDFDQLARFESGIDRSDDVLAQAIFPNLHQWFVAVGNASEVFSL